METNSDKRIKEIEEDLEEDMTKDQKEWHLSIFFLFYFFFGKIREFSIIACQVSRLRPF